MPLAGDNRTGTVRPPRQAAIRQKELILSYECLKSFYCNCCLPETLKQWKEHVDFTREPIIETVITPKEGCKLVVRSSKSNAQEEHFVDAIEVVSFGHSFFFRSLERPKTFLVPATDYEILEVREARMVLKNVGIDRAIKIGGGREGQMRTQREPHVEKAEIPSEESTSSEGEESAVGQPAAEKIQEGRIDKKRDRRRNYRRRRGREGSLEDEGQEGENTFKTESKETDGAEGENSPLTQQVITTSILTSLLPPPPTLISETIARYKDNALFKDAFYTKEERTPHPSVEEQPTIPQPEYGTFELSEEEEERIYQQRKQQGSIPPENEEEKEKSKGEENDEKKDLFHNDDPF